MTIVIEHDKNGILNKIDANPDKFISIVEDLFGKIPPNQMNWL
jgi:hypothetical protein